MIEEEGPTIQKFKGTFPSNSLCILVNLIYFSQFASLPRPTIINEPDVDLDPNDNGGRMRKERCAMVSCSSPLRIVARWLSGLSKGRRMREDDLAPIGRSTNCLDHCGPLDLEACRRDASFDVGIGCFLFYLVATSKNELNKMMELRNQMEMLLGNAKEELQKKKLQAKPFEHSTTDGHEAPEVNNHGFPPQVASASISLEESLTGMVCDPALKHHVSKPERYPMDQIEWELEGELECLQIDAEASKQYPKHRKPKVANKDESHILMSREVKDEVIYPGYGVCPYELERKLHELLETRQQEQIQELEAAVRRVQRRLHEKETEVSWWKDAAYLLSQRVPESCKTGLERCLPESGLERSVPESSKTDSESCVPESS